MNHNQNFSKIAFPDRLFIIFANILFTGYWLSYILADNSKFYGANYYPGLLNYEFFAQTFTVLLSLLVLVRVLLSNKSLYLSRCTLLFCLLLFLFIGWILLSSLWSVNEGFGWKETRVWVGYAPLAFALAFCAGEFKQIRYSLLTLLATQATCISLVVIYAYYANGCYVPYITFYLNRSLLGEMIIVSIPLLIAYGLLRDRVYHVFLRISALLGYIAVLIMAQRAPLYALWVTLLVSLLLAFIKYEVYRRRIILFSLFIIMSTIFFLTPSQFTAGLENWDTAKRAYDINQAKDTFHYRINGALVSFFQWKDNWLLGTGQGTYPLVFPKYSAEIVKAGFEKYAKKTEDKQISRAHCEPTQVAGELGIIGFTLWMILFVFFPLYLCLCGWKQNNIVMLMGSWGLLAISISGLASSFSPRLVTTGVWYVLTTILLTLNWKSPSICVNRTQLSIFALIAVFSSSLVLGSTYKTQRILYYYYLIQISKDLPGATYAKELNKYKKLVAQDPDYHYFYFAIANTMASHGNLKEEASSHFWRKAQDYGLFSSNLLASEALSLYLQGKTSDSLKRLDEGLHIFPDSWFLQSIKAAIMENESALSTEEIWVNATKINPEATGVARRIFKEMFTGQKQNISYQELYKISPEYYAPFSVYYFNIHPENRRLPRLFNQETTASWETP